MDNQTNSTSEKSEKNESGYSQSGQAAPEAGASNTVVAKFGKDESVLVYGRNSKHDIVPGLSSYHQDTIANFLRRPVRAYTSSWALGASVDTAVDLWPAFLGDTFIADKVANYRFIRGTICARVIITGSPYHVGMMLVTALNWPNRQGTRPYGDLSHPFTDQLVVRSTADLVGFLNPASDTSLEFRVPFVHNRHYIDLATSSTYTGIAQIYLTSFGTLQSASPGVVTDPTVQIYVWLEDAELTMPRAVGSLRKSAKVKRVKINAAPTEQDQATSGGPISNVASVVGTIAGRLTDIPYIGSMAKATEIGARAIGGIAKLFGFSTPTMLPSLTYVLNRHLPFMASTEAPTPSELLALDPRNEVTIDPMASGDPDGEDTLAIMSIAKRYGYLTYFDWSTTAAVDDELWFSNVNPCFAPTIQSGTTNFYYSTPLPVAIASWPFRYWSGTLVYRFVVQASAFHRGKLRFYYQPVSTTSGATSFTSTFSYILDLEETRDVELEVTWAQSIGWCLTLKDKNTLYWKTPSGGIPGSNVNTFNGILRVTVLNTLQAPIASSSVRLNVFVRAGDDFRVAVPDQPGDSMLAYMATTDERVVDTGTTADVTVPKTLAVMEPHRVAPELLLSTMGEEVTSFRQLIKRWAVNVAHEVEADGQDGGFLDLPMYPIPRGQWPSGQVPALAHFTYAVSNYYWNDAPLSPFHLMSACHLGVRGSMKWRLFQFRPQPCLVKRNRIAQGQELYPYTPWDFTTGALQAGAYTTDLGWVGASVAQKNVNDGNLDWSLPYYCPYRFKFNTDLPALDGQGKDTDMSQILFYQFHDSTLPKAWLQGISYYAAGEDLTFVKFMYTPVLMWYSDNPYS